MNRKSMISPRRRAGELAVMSRRLKQEVTKRCVAEQSLKKSERHYGLLLEQSRLMQDQLRDLSHQILLAQEEERKRISRELHDEIAQTLAGINVYLGALKAGSAVDARHLGRKIARTQRLVEKSVDIVHRFARELRPMVLDDLGLIPALHSFMKTFTKRTHIRVHFTAYAGIEKLDMIQRTMLFRVAQEALTNVSRHAEAARVRVSLQKTADGVLMEIHDDGRSFHVERVLLSKRNKRLGLAGMRERMETVGGSFSIASAPGKGTTVRAQIPAGKNSALNHL